VREALISSGVDLFPFDMDVVRQMEKQDKQEYKPPWAVIGSTDAYLEAGHNVYQRTRASGATPRPSGRAPANPPLTPSAPPRGGAQASTRGATPSRPSRGTPTCPRCAT